MKRTRPFGPGDILLSIFNSLVQPAHFKIIVVLFGETVPKLCSPNFRNSKTVRLVLLLIQATLLMLIYLLKNSVGENLILNDKSIGLLWSLNRSMVLLPHYLREKFVERGSITDYSLRDTESKLAIPLPRTNFM